MTKLKKFIKQNQKVTDNDFQKLRDFGYDDKDILEILTVMEMCIGYNKIISALNIGVDE